MNNDTEGQKAIDELNGVEYDSKVISVSAVSYTHLDVYKRQVILFSVLLTVSCLLVSFANSFALLLVGSCLNYIIPNPQRVQLL